MDSDHIAGMIDRMLGEFIVPATHQVVQAMDALEGGPRDRTLIISFALADDGEAYNSTATVAHDIVVTRDGITVDQLAAIYDAAAQQDRVRTDGSEASEDTIARLKARLRGGGTDAA